MMDLEELRQQLGARFFDAFSKVKECINFNAAPIAGMSQPYPPPSYPQARRFMFEDQIMELLAHFFNELKFKEHCGSYAPSYVLVSKLSSQISDTATKVITASGAQWDYWGTQMSQVLPEISFIGRVSKQLQELPPGFYVWVGHFYDEKGAPNISGEFRSLTSDEITMLSTGKIPWS
jgi:hypothetical protein